MTEKFDGLASMIGNTPMLEIHLNYRGEPRRVFAKAEYYNFSGSIKDRVAYHMLKKAYCSGLISEKLPIIEASSGNMGIAFAAVGAYLGNPVYIFMPDWMSKERVNLIQSYGASVITVSREQGGFRGSVELADEMGYSLGAFLPHQFSNPENTNAHYLTTGQEIISQIDRLGVRADCIVSGVGTGGTLMGVGKAVKGAYPDCRTFAVDPLNCQVLTSSGMVSGSHRIAGIGDEFIPDILKMDEIDDIVVVDDGDAINMARKLARSLGLGVGISSGANFLGALMAQDALGDKDSVAVTIFADDSKKYLSTDLMTEQPVNPGHISGDVELIGFRSLK